MRPHSNPSEYPSKLLVKIPSGQNQAESLTGLAKLFNKGHSRKRSLGMICDLLPSGGLFSDDLTAADFSTVIFSTQGFFSTF